MLPLLLLSLTGPTPALAQTAPAITSQPQSQAINLRAPAVFSVTAAGTPPLFYQWFFNGSLIPGATSSSLSFGSVTNAQVGNYVVTVSNTIGGVTSDPATLSVIQVPEILGPAPGPGYAAIPYAYALTARNSPTSFSASGLPPGLVLNASTGTISGTPTTAGSYVAVVAATNSLGTGGGVNFAFEIKPTPTVFVNLAGNSAGSADGTGFVAQFRNAFGIALDAAGNAFVTDSTNNNVRKITPEGVVTTVAGLAGQSGAADGSGSAARFNSPTGIAVDASGNLYVSDTGNQLIRKISPAGAVSTLAGVYGQIGANDGAGGGARFNFPQGLAVDGAGNVFVADTGNHVIREITPAGIVLTLAGAAGQNGAVDGADTAARFSGPTGVATDPADNVFVLDNGNAAVRKITPGGIVTTVAQQLFRTDANGTQTRHTPNAIAVDAFDDVFLTYGPVAGSIFAGVFLSQGEISEVTPAGTPVAPALSGLNPVSPSVQGIAVDGHGRIFVVTGLNVYAWGFAAGPSILTQPQDVTASFGQTATFGVAIGDLFPTTPSPSYQWQMDGVPIPGTTNPTATTSTLSVTAGAANATYSVVVSTAYGAVTSDDATLTVNLPAGPAPVILSQPQSVTVNNFGTAALTVTPTDFSPLAYQWYKNGAAIAGANGATLILSGVTPGNAGTYTVTLARAGGFVTSEAAALTVTNGSASRITNLSVRTNLANGQDLIAGFITSGPEDLLIRAVGPSLAPYDLTSVYPDPRFTVYDDHGGTIDQNDDWNTGLAPTFAEVGAFPLSTGSKDAALVRSISGASTAVINGTGSGVMLMEVYDTEPATSPNRLVNVSARNQVGTGDNVLITGFVIDGTFARTLLIRGIGPALHDGFGIEGALSNPRLEIHTTVNGQDTIVAANDNWDASLKTTFDQVGAFQITPGSKDAALLITLPPGIYTAQVSGVNSGTGDGLVEVYVVGP